MVFATRHNYTAEQVIEHTNARLVTWYENAKIDYNVDGFGEARLIGDEIVVAYKENGRVGKYSVGYWQEENISYVFDVWSEQADIDEDELLKDKE